MSIKEKDIKLLWGRAAGRCSFPDCRIKLTQNKNGNIEPYNYGQHAHIVAETLDGPRGGSKLSDIERNSYGNLMLLCPNHHAIIDKNIDEYSIEKLHSIKTNHELWVEEILSGHQNRRQLASEIIYTDLIDAAVESCELEKWEIWTSQAISTSPNWDEDMPDKIFRFRQKIIKAIWPGIFPELENALKALSIAVHVLAQTFLKHCERNDGILREIKFYKLREHKQEQYNYLLNKYNQWIDACFNLMVESAKSANWMADVVRRDINPLFFAKQGKFILTYGPDFNFSFRTVLFEYSDEEKKKLPDSLIERLSKKSVD